MKIVGLSILVFACVVLAGCSPSASSIQAQKAFKMPDKVEVTSENYLIRPPDEILLNIPTIAEINLQQQRVRPDGRISFTNLGEFDIAGKTPQQAADMIRERASKLYTMAGDHPLDMRISVFGSAVYYVLGEVQRPGPKPYTGRDMALKAVSDAYPTVMAWKSRIRVVRPSADPAKKPQIFEIQWGKMVSYGNTEKNVLLQEGDIIYAPPTILASIGMKLEEFIRPVGRALFAVSATD